MTDRVREKIARFLKRQTVDDSQVLTDLVPESFVLVEMVIELQEDFGVRLMQEELRDIKTVGELARLVARKVSG